jgi:hypothetical protein
MLLDFSIRLKKFKYENLSQFIDSVELGKIDTIDNLAPAGLSVLNNKIFAGGTSNYQFTWYFSDKKSFYLLAELDTGLTLHWQKFYSYNNDYLFLWKVLRTNDGGILLAGTKHNHLINGPQERDIYVIKLDSLGNFVTGVNNPSGVQVHDFIVYPNPAQNHLNVQYSSVKKSGKATLINSTGQQVEEIILPANSTGKTINIEHLPSGIYLLRLQTDAYSGAKKFVKY